MSRCALNIALLLTAAIASLSCTIVAPGGGQATSKGQEQTGYLMSDASTVLFIQWTSVDKKISGQLQVFSIGGRFEKTADISTHPFSGMSDGQNVSINFTGSIWLDGLGGKTWTGTLTNDALTLVVPSNNGMLMPLTFKAATVDEYNKAVVALKQQAGQVNAKILQERREAAAAEAQRQAITEQQSAVENANRELASVMAALKSQTKELSGVATVEGVIRQFDGSIARMQKAVSRLKEKAAEARLTDSRLREVEAILRQVEADKRVVESDVRSMEAAIRNIESYERPVEDGLNRLTSASDDLRRALAANTTNVPQAQFSEQDIMETKRMAEAAMRLAKSVIENGSRRASGYDNQAQKILDGATDFVGKLKAVED
jgi:hypothetical protein